MLGFHSLKYYIFTFGHNINNVQKKKRACVRASMHAMSSNTNRKTHFTYLLLGLLYVDNNSNNSNHNNAHKQEQVTLGENILGSVSPILCASYALPCLQPFIRFILYIEPIFTPLQIKCHYGAYSI